MGTLAITKLLAFSTRATTARHGILLRVAATSPEINDYWVVGQEFQAMTIIFAFDHGSGNLIRTFGPVGVIHADERNAILQALDQWDKITIPGELR